MAQLLAVGIIAFGLLVISSAIFIASREKKTSVSSIPTVSEQETSSTVSEPQTTSAPVLQQSATKEIAVAENTSEPTKPILHLYAGEQSSAWWQEQIHSLTAQLHYLRDHAKDVERQIAILSEIAALAAELEMLQKKRDVLPESKISLFPLQVHRQPTDMSYMTDKRPAVRKYTIEAMS